MMITVTGDGDGNLDELGELLRTAGVVTVGEMVQTRTEPDPDRYFGRGKLDEAKARLEEIGANLVAYQQSGAAKALNFSWVWRTN